MSSPAQISRPDRPIEYPPDMQLVRQIEISRLGPEAGSALDWLTSGQARNAGLAELLDGVMARLAAAGLPFHRSTLHMGTLHPQLVGFSAAWRSDRSRCDEIRINAHVRETEDFLLSPLKPVIEKGETVRVDPRNPEAAARYPIMKSLAEAGLTDYWAFPLPRLQNFFNVMSVSTRAPDGFPADAVAALKQLLPVFALNLEIVSLSRIAENVLGAYLGERSGRRVLDGEIRRGSGEMIDAIVWFSDMRGYTSLSDRLPGSDMLRLLNAYFERLVGSVHSEGGEVLKFMGDGLLAIFPIAPATPASKAAVSALSAARNGLAAVRALNGVDGDALNIGHAWRPVDAAVALHRGSVFFGNIGSSDRLDFTVTGPAVNHASRVEPLSKQVGRRLLVTSDVADLLDEPLEPLGSFEFRGVAEPVAVLSATE